MDNIKEIAVNIDDKLYLNRYVVDNIPHLKIIDSKICKTCKAKSCLTFCPAGVYKLEDNNLSLSYEGCLECGACRIACCNNNIEWNYPRGGYGIAYRLA